MVRANHRPRTFRRDIRDVAREKGTPADLATLVEHYGEHRVLQGLMRLALENSAPPAKRVGALQAMRRMPLTQNLMKHLPQIRGIMFSKHHRLGMREAAMGVLVHCRGQEAIPELNKLEKELTQEITDNLLSKRGEIPAIDRFREKVAALSGKISKFHTLQSSRPDLNTPQKRLNFIKSVVDANPKDNGTASLLSRVITDKGEAQDVRKFAALALIGMNTEWSNGISLRMIPVLAEAAGLDRMPAREMNDFIAMRLAHNKSDAAARLLEHVLANKNANPLVRRNAATLLQIMGTPVAERILKHHISAIREVEEELRMTGRDPVNPRPGTNFQSFGVKSTPRVKNQRRRQARGLVRAFLADVPQKPAGKTAGKPPAKAGAKTRLNQGKKTKK